MIRRRANAGFTLIEMLAVIALFALIAAMVVPSLDLGGSRAVRSEAADLAAAFEFARQRAVMTGRTHVVVVDVDASAHWVEWAAPPEPGGAQAGEAPPPGAPPQLDLVPPALATEQLVPVAGEFGRRHVADDRVAIVGVEIGDGLADAGEVELRIDGDGASEAAAIVVADRDGVAAVRIEIEPLADLVRVVNVE